MDFSLSGPTAEARPSRRRLFGMMFSGLVLWKDEAVRTFAAGLGLAMALGFSFSGWAQAGSDEFRIIPTMVEIAERGKVESVLIQCLQYSITLNPPADYSMRPDLPRRTLTYVSQEGTVALSLHFTTNFPSSLPGPERLRQIVAKQYPDGTIYYTSDCVTGVGTGWFCDVERYSTPTVRSITRHGFVSVKGGSIEFIFSTEKSRFAGLQHTIGPLLSSLHLEPRPLQTTTLP